MSVVRRHADSTNRIRATRGYLLGTRDPRFARLLHKYDAQALPGFGCR